MSHVPLRQCCGCRERRPQPDMVRTACTATSVVVARHAPGRGAWVCSLDCAEVALRKGGFARSFRRSLTADEQQTLRSQLQMAFDAHH